MSGNRARAAAPSKAVAHRPANVLNDALEPGAYRVGNLPQDYPQVVHPNDNRDTKYDLLGVIAPQPMYQVTDKDVQYIEDKEKARQYAEFLAFMRTQFNMADQAEAWIARQTFPDMFDGPQKYFDAMMDNVKTFTKINMRGPNSMDDYFFLWKILSGTIHIPAGFEAGQLTAPLASVNNVVAAQNQFNAASRGLFNPRRYLAKSAAPRVPVMLGRDPRNTANPFMDHQTPALIPGVDSVTTGAHANMFGGTAYDAVTKDMRSTPVARGNAPNAWNLFSR